jgi:uncharacterized membrane protein
VQPLRPEVRAALKRAHPGLTDATINRVQELLVLRSQLEPRRYADQIEALDRERVALMEAQIPRYAEVVQALKRSRDADVTASVKITQIKGPRQSNGGKTRLARGKRERTAPKRSRTRRQTRGKSRRDTSAS